MNRLTILICALLMGMGIAIEGHAADSVTICGTVVDRVGQPIEGASVEWKTSNFQTAFAAVTDEQGRFSRRIPCGRYQAISAIRPFDNPNSKACTADSAHQRAAFWAWDFVADRDTTLELRYDRIEVSGMQAFRIPGGAPLLQLYLRPMTLTRTAQWARNQKRTANLAPCADSIDIKVLINGMPTRTLMQQEIRELISQQSSTNAYLVTLPLPQQRTRRPFYLVQVEVTDLATKEVGEGWLYLAK